jgi:hypothetical protein
MFRRKLTDAVNTAWFSYVTILLLQLKLVWGIWLFRDLTSGDTSSYFLGAAEWVRNGKGPITWSPLYTLFYGILLKISNDAYISTILHRMIIVLVLAIVVLAVMRQLLPPGYAWLAAAWWVILPIDFNSLYEVHLFTVIPILLAFLAILWQPGPWGRGFGIAALLVSGILMRNELLIPAGLFAAICLGWELRRLRQGDQATPGTGRAYAIPVAAAVLLISVFYLRASDASMIRPLLRVKHTLNICQVYAFGYQQRHSDWQGSPWTGCQQLMTRDFGVAEPSLTEALRRNPAAILEHFWWNLQLAPNGVQVLLLNGMTGDVNPDYVPVNRYSWALPVSLVICAIVIGGLVLLFRERQYWWKFWLRDRIWAWIAMACVACVVPVIILTQRPRPSYLLAFGIALRAAIGMCAFVVARRWRYTLPVSLVPVAAIVLLALTPPYYAQEPPARPLLDSYSILSPFHDWFERPNVRLVAAGWSDELCFYVSRSRVCRGVDFADIRRQVTAQTPFHKVLSDNAASVFFANEVVQADPVARRFIGEARSHGWRQVASRHDKYRNWDLLIKVTPGLPGEPDLDESIRDIVDPAGHVTLGDRWHPAELEQGIPLRWVTNDAELALDSHTAGPVTLCLKIEPGPGLNGKPLTLQVLTGGVVVQTVNVPLKQVVKLTLPDGEKRFRLHTMSENKPTPNDPRILNFRVFRIWTE